ncbi:protein SNORC isoform X2 [Lissotriton helveticus]
MFECLVLGSAVCAAHRVPFVPTALHTLPLGGHSLEGPPASPAPTSSRHHRRSMVRPEVLLVLTLSGILVPAVLTEYPQDPSPTLWNEPPEIPSGAGPIGPTTAHSEMTAVPPYTADSNIEDTTHLLENGDGSLGSGAIATIVIAALLGSSVIVALLVITLRKFSAS